MNDRVEEKGSGLAGKGREDEGGLYVEVTYHISNMEKVDPVLHYHFTLLK